MLPAFGGPLGDQLRRQEVGVCSPPSHEPLRRKPPGLQRLGVLQENGHLDLCQEWRRRHHRAMSLDVNGAGCRPEIAFARAAGSWTSSPTTSTGSLVSHRIPAAPIFQLLFPPHTSASEPAYHASLLKTICCRNDASGSEAARASPALLTMPFGFAPPATPSPWSRRSSWQAPPRPFGQNAWDGRPATCSSHGTIFCVYRQERGVNRVQSASGQCSMGFHRSLTLTQTQYVLDAGNNQARPLHRPGATRSQKPRFL